MRTTAFLSKLNIASLLFLSIGVGNISIAYTKEQHLQKALRDATVISPGTEKTDTLLVERIASKQKFYRIVSVGGFGFLLLSAGLLGLDISRRRRT